MVSLLFCSFVAFAKINAITLSQNKWTPLSNANKKWRQQGIRSIFYSLCTTTEWQVWCLIIINNSEDYRQNKNRYQNMYHDIGPNGACTVCKFGHGTGRIYVQNTMWYRYTVYLRSLHRHIITNFRLTEMMRHSSLGIHLHDEKERKHVVNHNSAQIVALMTEDA